MWWVSKPLSRREAEAGKEPGKENVSHPEPGLWVQLELGSSTEVRRREGG